MGFKPLGDVAAEVAWPTDPGVTGTTPCSDVMFARRLCTMFDFANLGKVPFEHLGQRPTSQVRIGTNLAQASPERLASLPDWCGLHLRKGCSRRVG